MIKNDQLPATAGEGITIVEATNYVDEYLDLKKALKKDVLTKITSSERLNTDKKVKEAEKYFQSNANAFIFSREMITRFFDVTEKNPNPAEFLIVFLGARYADPEKSNPTVVVAGVNRHPEKANTYVSLNIDFPATQHPPKIADYQFPGPDKDNSTNIEITLL